MKRFQTENILQDLRKKLVILAGPRQSGKTFLAKQIAQHYRHPIYLNYDLLTDRIIIEKMQWLPNVDLLILDELHKMPLWKNYLKGLYDTKPDSLHILVTGSARLDQFNMQGDSLAGRYFLHRLLPFSPAEFNMIGEPIDLDRFILRSGFPEPYLADQALEAARWRQHYLRDLAQSDVLTIENIHDQRVMNTLVELLRSRVGSSISYQGLARDLACAPNTVKKYIEILESVYLVFRVTPFSRNIARSLLKEPKIYFYDSGLVTAGEGAQLENAVAFALLKHCYLQMDCAARSMQLHYLRTKDGKEIDFVLAENHVSRLLVEVKTQDEAITPALLQFSDQLNTPGVQVVKYVRQERQINDLVQLKKVEHFLAECT